MKETHQEINKYDTEYILINAINFAYHPPSIIKFGLFFVNLRLEVVSLDLSETRMLPGFQQALQVFVNLRNWGSKKKQLYSKTDYIENVPFQID